MKIPSTQVGPQAPDQPQGGPQEAMRIPMSSAGSSGIRVGPQHSCLSPSTQLSPCPRAVPLVPSSPLPSPCRMFRRTYTAVGPSYSTSVLNCLKVPGGKQHPKDPPAKAAVQRGSAQDGWGRRRVALLALPGTAGHRWALWTTAGHRWASQWALVGIAGRCWGSPGIIGCC